MTMRTQSISRTAVAAAIAVFVALVVLPALAAAAEPDDTIDGASLLVSGETTAGLFSPAGERDFFRFQAQGGHTYSLVATDPATSGSDPVLSLGDYSYHAVRMYNDARLAGSRDAGINWSCETTGTHYVLVDDARSRGGAYSLSLTDLGELAPGSGTRIGGANRYAVARNLALEQMGGSWECTSVIVTSGLDRSAADPLAASGLAGTLDCPILLANQDSRTRALPSETRDALVKMRAANGPSPFKVWIVGGRASVPDWVRRQILLAYPGATFERVSGVDRYACAAAVARRIRQLRGATPEMAFIANGETSAYFFDAMAAAPVAYARCAPVLLTKRASLPAATSLELTRGSYPERFVVGDTPEVLTTVVTACEATRIGASASSYDRTLVARRFAEWAVAQGYASRSPMTVANKLPDALTGSCLAGSRGGVSLFVKGAGTIGQHLEDYTQQGRCVDGEPDFTLIGGEVSIGASVLDRMRVLVGD